ncbi:MAG: type II toxin-antitoxin system Phd/YefM family antitoxin [Caldilineaceae bacterium SB0675_bin_29]|uniref:Antitoxin n=1 Tax=Caldilineaceae bacterium SB0675_bin_29 TaxID=2605266 RepID=A0A6B1G5P7_9CHLR|nr:type II toxin-antitoxin system Phd/YefM family antitoxin [Caldilineaceae bacterium SB0675_bin_29]
MRTVGVSELKTHTSEIIRNVRENRISFTITFRGRPVGVLLPIEEDEKVVPGKDQDSWSELERLREEFARRPRPEKSLTEALTEMRR